MANKRYVVELSAEERARLSEMIAKGRSSAKAILKARILLEADQGEGEGWTDERICEALDTNVTMVARVRAKLVTEGLDAVLARKRRARPPIEPIFDGERQAQLIALACSEPPEGHARWSIRLLAASVVEREIVWHEWRIDHLFDDDVPAGLDDERRFRRELGTREPQRPRALREVRENVDRRERGRHILQ